MKQTAPKYDRSRDSYLRIWEAVRRIPRGRVSTYGTIARKAGLAGQARLVGYALHNLPEGADVPWHRVVNARGEVSLRAAGGGDNRQRRAISAEGIRITNGKIDLVTFGWPRDAFRPSR